DRWGCRCGDGWRRRRGHAGVVLPRARVVDGRTDCDGGDHHHGRTGDGQRAAEGGSPPSGQAARRNGDPIRKSLHVTRELAVLVALHAIASRTFARARLSTGPTLAGTIPSASLIPS